MTIGTPLRRKVSAVLATAAVAAISAPAALADPPQGHRAQQAQPDLVERYVASGRGQADLVERWVGARGGRPDGYQPQLRAASGATTSVEDGFAWGDAGLGALAGFVLALVAGGTFVAARGRSRMAHS